jgi:hypothetical protein
LDLSCGELVTGSADGLGWTVSGTSDGGRTPDISSSDSLLRVSSTEQRGVSIGIKGSTWGITLPRQVSIAMDLAVNAGSARMDLAQMRVPELSVSVNAADATVTARDLLQARSVTATVNAGALAISLPTPEATLTGTLSVNAGSIEVCVPDGAGLRIRLDDSALGSSNFAERGLVRAGSTWTRPGFDSLSQRIDLTASANLGSITLNPESGCE